MNGMQVDNIQQLPAAGWTNADFLVDPNTYLFYNSSFSANGTITMTYSFPYLPTHSPIPSIPYIPIYHLHS